VLLSCRTNLDLSPTEIPRVEPGNCGPYLSATCGETCRSQVSEQSIQLIADVEAPGRAAKDRNRTRSKRASARRGFRLRMFVTSLQSY